MTIEDKLSSTRFSLDRQPHIKVETQRCQDCDTKPCLYVCPVQNYSLIEAQIVFSWQACVECGACRIVCAYGAIDWNYPRGGFGLQLRFG
jgi:ferredoxin like protein